MPATEHRLVSFDKTPLFYRRVRPSTSSRGQLLVIHGMGEHGGRYLPLAEHLSTKGFASVLPDLRGFGRSGGVKAGVRDFSDYLRDLDAIHTATREPQKEPPLFVLGHSFGGLVGTAWVSERAGLACRGLLLSSPNFGIAIPIPRWQHHLAILASYLLPDHAQPNRVDTQRLTHDKAVMAAYPKDTLIVHRITTRLYREMTRQFHASQERARKIRCAVLLLQAGDDHVVCQEDSVRFFESLKVEDKTMEILDGLYHEILNEVGREAIYANIAGWLERRA